MVDQVIANTMFGEEGLQALNSDCPDLQRMDVANFQLVSKEGLHALDAVALVCRTSFLQIDSWSARRAFGH